MKSEIKSSDLLNNRKETKELKETLTGEDIRGTKSFRSYSEIDLWNVRRRQRTMASMRRCN